VANNTIFSIFAIDVKWVTWRYCC